MRKKPNTRGMIVLAALLLSGCCSTVTAPYEFTGKVQERHTDDTEPNHLVLPPGTSINSGSIRLLLEQDDASSACQRLPKINGAGFTVSSVYWTDIGKRAIQIDVPDDEAGCLKLKPGDLRACLRNKLSTQVKEKIDEDASWSACKPNLDSLDAVFPYHVRESLRDDLGFGLGENDELVTVHPRAGMNVCVSSETTLTGTDNDMARLPTGEQCQQFLPQKDGRLAFSRFDRFTSSAITGLSGAQSNIAIYETNSWSVIRSHAVGNYNNAFYLAVYFPSTQSMKQTWVGGVDFILRIQNGDALDAGPLIVLSTTDKVRPNSRKIEMKDLCTGNQRSCFIFRDRPSVRITQPIWFGESLLHFELGTTMDDIPTIVAIEPGHLELMRQYRGEKTPMKGDTGMVPLILGDYVRRTHD